MSTDEIACMSFNAMNQQITALIAKQSTPGSWQLIAGRVQELIQEDGEPGEPGDRDEGVAPQQRPPGHDTAGGPRPRPV